MNTNELKNWIISNNIELKAIEGFNYAFANYKKDYPDEFNNLFFNYDEKYLERYLSQVSLSIVDWGYSNEERIIAYIKIRYDAMPMGEYKIIYDLSGKVVDDYLVLE